MPVATARRLCPNGTYIPANHGKYQAASARVMKVLREFSPILEVVSVDEAYLDLTGTERLHGPPVAAAARIRGRIGEEVGCSASVGMASNRLLSKVASELAKPAGILHILPGMEAALLAPLSVGAIPGIGKVTQGHLLAMGIRTVGDLARLPEEVLEKKFKRHGLDLYRKAQGEDADELALERRPKSLGKETTFEADEDDPVRLEAVLSRLAEGAASRTRKADLRAKGVTLKIRFADFAAYTRAALLDPAAALDRPVIETALGLLRRALGELAGGRRVRLLGVYLTGLAEAQGQLSLLEDGDFAKERSITQGVDTVRERFGEDALLAGRGIDRLGEKKERKR
jgi:DNA polymerase-4